MIQQINVEEKHVVITGAAGRLGRHLVEAFSLWGAEVTALVRNGEDAARLALPHGLPTPKVHACDLTNGDAARTTFTEIAEQGRPDVIIHAVGTWAMTPLLSTPEEEWQRVIDANLTSTYVCFREAVRVMEPGPGVLIAFASGQGADGAAARQGAYSAAKAGVIRIAESIDAEYRSSSLRAHVIAPSFILYGEAQDGEDQAGVHADELAVLCRLLAGQAGASMRGTVIRAYGNRH